jgi:Bacteriophage abortive infection AbiH
MATEKSTDHPNLLYENLYIIGNGFDRCHQLETNYQEFAFYLQNYHSDIHDLLTEYYGLPYLNPEVEEDHWDPLWSDFERTLADLDFEQVLEDNSEYQANPRQKFSEIGIGIAIRYRWKASSII